MGRAVGGRRGVKCGDTAVRASPPPSVRPGSQIPQQMALLGAVPTSATCWLDHTSLNERLGLYPTGIAPRYRLMERNAGVAGRWMGRSLCAEGAGFLHQVDLGARDCGGGDESAVLGADEGEVALGDVGTVLGGFELALESSYPRHALLGDALLWNGEIITLNDCPEHTDQTGRYCRGGLLGLVKLLNFRVIISTLNRWRNID